jgi:plasmid maintenance system antidote protein VapI
VNGRRYPIEPLAEAMRCSINALGQQLHISGSYLNDLRHRGLSHRTADRLAVAAGFHPYEVWPEMHAHALEDSRDDEHLDDTPAERTCRRQRAYARAKRRSTAA